MRKIVLILLIIPIGVVNIFAQLPKGQIQIGGVSDTVYTMCQGSPLIMTALPAGAATYYWQTASGSSLGSTQSITVTPSVGVTRYEVYINVAGIIYYAKIDVTVNSLPVVQALTSFTGCDSSSILLKSTSGPMPSYAYQWQENGLNISGATAYDYNLSILATKQGNTYRCKVTAPYGCSTWTNSATLTTVNPLPTATFVPVGPICVGNSTPLVVTPLTGVSPWTITMTNGVTDLVLPNNTNPVVGATGATTFTVQPGATTTYHFTIVDSNGCSLSY